MSASKHKKCQDDVAAGMGGATLTHAENLMVEQWCVALSVIQIIWLLKFNRAAVELSSLFKANDCEQDTELWDLAIIFLSASLNPQAAFDQAKSDLDKSRSARADIEITSVVERVRRAREVAKGAPITVPPLHPKK